MLHDPTFPYRVAFGFAFFVVQGTRDAIQNPADPRRLKEYGFLFGVTALVMIYGALHDAITFSLSPEYFRDIKGLRAERYFFEVLELALTASWTVGLVIGLGYLVANNPSPLRPQLPYRDLAARLAWPLVLSPLLASIALGIAICAPDRVGAVLDVPRYAPDAPRALVFVWAIHLGSYAGAALGWIVGIASIRRARGCAVREPGYNTPVLRLDNVSKRHGPQILYVDGSMSVERGEKVGLVGPNGSGKTTIFRLIMKEEGPDAGSVVIDRGITIGYFSQDVGEMSGRSIVEETIAGAGEVGAIHHELGILERRMADPDEADQLDVILARFGEVQARFDELNGYALDANAREILAGLGFEQSRMDEDVAKLSGGWKMRVALARILLMKPDALLLDEPTNHLDIESIVWLERFLKAYEGALVVTSHDRELMNRLVNKIVEIDGGELTTYSGNYDFYEQQRALADKQREAQFARQEAMLAKERAFIERFKARASHAAQVQSRVKKLDKIEKIEPPRQRKIVEFEFNEPPRSGDDVATLSGVRKAYGQRVVYDGFDLLLRRKERWCVMGVNGAGKSTLLKLVAGETKPDDGSVRIGASVRLGYFAQHAMELLLPDETVLATLERNFPRASGGSLRTLLGAFGFSGNDVEKPCRILSGGEKARVVLAVMLYQPPNFLVLDEPTNHLDLDTKQMLVGKLAGFEGTMLFVSHDRQFLGALSNRVLELGADGVRTYGGGYKEYVAASGQEAPGVR